MKPQELHRAREIQNWLLADQYEHGEWGKCEIKDPSSHPRTIELSRQKPNIFTSSQAAYALIATGMGDSPSITKYLEWLSDLRDSEGWWRSASGSRVPMGTTRGWSEVPNIRHTAKGLDVLLLRNDFRPDDARVLRDVLDTQLDSGGFSQVKGGDADIWSTAYVMNLIIRCIEPQGFTKQFREASRKMSGQGF